MTKVWKLLNKKNVFFIFLLVVVEAFLFLIIPTLAAQILNNSAVGGSLDYNLTIGLVMLLAGVTNIFVAIISVRLSAKESQGLGNQLRKKMFDNIMDFSAQDINEFGTSTLITRTTNDVMQIQLVTMLSLRIIFMSPIVIIISFILAINLESRLAWIFAVVFLLITVVVSIVFKFANPHFRSVQKKTDKLNQVFREGLTGIRVIRAFNTTEYEEEKFDEANKDYRDTMIRANSILHFMLPSFIIIIGIANILIFIFGTDLIAANSMGVGNIIAFIQYSAQILFSVVNVSMILLFLPRAQVSAERIVEVIETAPSIQDPADPIPMEEAEEVSLSLEGVTYQFSGAEKPAVENITFSAERGETIAIIGGTGSGKTTIANLIPRLYEASSGQIKVNGIDIKDLTLSDLRQVIGYIPQKALLFTGTIRSNMQYGKPDATDEEIWHALEIAQGKDFVMGLDKGLDSRVDQGGVNFSGGQRQRLSIARAIVTQPDLYIFDDSFSALDFKTDARLRQALKPETKDAVTLIIAQRINTVTDADHIIVLENGCIVGQGRHEELKETNKAYQEIMRSQMKGEDL